ncbi:XRE family transcriptional regulator [Flavobacterium oreochromis]|uniref:helix-turn-helix domain-containing protein n=1 Tax=Flavobacterium oreochromis TaxID=2906078 RepID=UPI00385AE598
MKNAFATNLNRARKNRGLTMEELASMVKCTKQAISHYENSLRMPDSKTLISIAEVLGYDIDYFYKGTYDVNFSLLKVNYRDGYFLNEKERNSVEEIVEKSLNEYLELENIADELVKFDNPLHDLFITSFDDVEKAAKQLRKKWKLGEGPIHNISSLLEKKGVRLMKIDFGYQYAHEGLSGWADNDIPVIIVNAKQQDVSRTRFTLLHELAHLLLNICKSICEDTVEKFCDTFAGAVLLPKEVLEEEFGKNRTAISMPELKRIKELYGISIIAIMVRAATTKLISWDSFNKWKQSDLSNYDFGQFDGVEEPKRFSQMLYRCLSERKIGLDKAAQLAHKDEIKLKQFYEQQLVF